MHLFQIKWKGLVAERNFTYCPFPPGNWSNEAGKVIRFGPKVSNFIKLLSHPFDRNETFTIVYTGDKRGQIIQLWDDFSLDFSRHKNLLKKSLCDFLEEFLIHVSFIVVF